jgi:cytoskeleton protein RodZ
MFEIGRSLREARTRRGLDLPQIERDTHIRGKYIVALEDEEFDALPGPAYAKGFLRTYADYLDLDSQQFIDEYNSRFTDEEHLGPPQLVKIRRRRRPGAWLVAVPIAAALVALIGWQVSRGGGHRAAHTPTSTRQDTTSVSTETITRAVNAAPTRARLVLTAARGRCWLMVRRVSATGPLVYESTVEQGQTVRFTAGTLWIRIGAPWNVDATLAGKALQLPSAIGNLIVTPTGSSPG